MVVTVSEKLPGTILYLSKEDNNLKIFKKFYEVFDLNFESNSTSISYFEELSLFK